MKPYYPEVLSRLGTQSGNLLEIGSGEGEFLVFASQNSDLKLKGYDVHEHAGRDDQRQSGEKQVAGRRIG